MSVSNAAIIRSPVRSLGILVLCVSVFSGCGQGRSSGPVPSPDPAESVPSIADSGAHALLPYVDGPAAARLARCDLPAAKQQVGLAQQYLSGRRYDVAERYAGSASMYVLACHRAHSDRIDGDATLIKAVAMRALGERDAESFGYAAAMNFLSCSDQSEYPHDYRWCRKQYPVAEELR